MNRNFHFSRRGLIPQFFILIILPLTALLLGVTFGGLALHRQAMRTLVGQRDERAVRAAAHALSDQLNQRISEIRLLASDASGGDTSQTLAGLIKRDDFLLASFDAGLAFYSPQGHLLASSGNIDAWKNISGQSELKEIFNPVAAPALYPLNLQNVAGLMLAAASTGTDGPIAVGAFSPESLIGQTLEDIFTPGEGGTAFVVTQNHRSLYHIGAQLDDANLATHPGIDAALAGNSGSTFSQEGGVEHVVAYSSIQPVGWALIIEEPWATVASPLLRTTEYAPLVLIPMLLLALFALWFVTRRIIQPLQGLEAKADELAWGNYDAIEGSAGGIAEIRHLQTALIHLAHKVNTYQQGLRGYIGAITMGQEEERHRLARELHDDTLQSLIALNQRLQLALLAQKEGAHPGRDQSSPADRNGLEEIQSLTEQTIQNLRRLTRALRPIYLEDLGLAAALETLAHETQQMSGVEVAFSRIGTEVRLSAPVELALYRIGQEALSNVVRHAHASQATLNITFAENLVRLKVNDDGMGFEVPVSPAEFAPTGHYGLLGLHERAEMIGGRLEIQSAPGQGTQVSLSLPLTPVVLPAENQLNKENVS